MAGIKSKDMDGFRMPLAVLGMAMVGLGGVMLLYLGMLVYQVLNEPEQVGLIRYVMAKIKIEDLAAYGHMVDSRTQQSVRFDIGLTETVRTLLYVFLGVAIMGALATVLGVLVRSGVKILELAVKQGEKTSPPPSARKQPPAQRPTAPPLRAGPPLTGR